MQYEHPNITVSSPAPGHYIIAGLRAGSTSTEEGRLVHPMSVHISPEVPNDLLYAIINDRGAVPGLVEEETVVLPGVKDSSTTEDVAWITDDITAALKEAGGTARIGDLAARFDISKEEIKSLAGNGFEIGNAGWVKLTNAGGEV